MAARSLVYPTVRIWAPWNLKMDAGAVLGPYVNCYNVDQVRIAEDALVSQGAYLCTASHDASRSDFPLISAPIQVESKAWVCTEAFIGLGVNVGFGAIVGARAVVSRNVKAQTIVAGNPAREVGQRNDAAVSEAVD